MKRHFLILISIVLLVVVSALGTQPARAANYFMIVTRADPESETCDENGFSVPINFKYNLPPKGVPIIVDALEAYNDVVELRASREVNLKGSGEYNQNFFPESRVPSTGIPYKFFRSDKSRFSVDGESYSMEIDITVICTLTYSVIVQISNSSGASEGLGGVPGPAVPAGFVLKTITCDVAVFNTPGGFPVGDNRIKAGQNWFVNPTPQKDEKGKPWTEVFVGGYSNGFVPTSCVGGQ